MHIHCCSLSSIVVAIEMTMFIHIQYGAREVNRSVNGTLDDHHDVLLFDSRVVTVRDVLRKMAVTFNTAWFLYNLFDEHDRQLLSKEFVDRARTYVIKRKSRQRTLYTSL